MSGKRKFIDILITIVAFAFFIIYYKEFLESIFSNIGLLLIGVVTVILVNTIKLVRLYIILYGKKLSGKETCFIYARTAMINSIFPYKAGELYRMYVIGTSLKSLQEGIIITLLDRLVDTIGLLTVMLLNLLLTNGKIYLQPVVSILMIFTFCVGAMYFVFPGLSSFWRKYLLKNRSSKHKLWGLEIISRLQLIYEDITEIVKGRGVMLLLTSITAWLIEIGSISIINKVTKSQINTINVTEYLNSILSGRVLIDNARYTILSVIWLCVICIVCLLIKKETKDEGVSCI